MMTVLTRKDAVGVDAYDSISWALEVHCKLTDMGLFNYAVLHGNEDSPERIDFWMTSEPNWNQEPDYVWTREEEGGE